MPGLLPAHQHRMRKTQSFFRGSLVLQRSRKVCRLFQHPAVAEKIRADFSEEVTHLSIKSCETNTNETWSILSPTGGMRQAPEEKLEATLRAEWEWRQVARAAAGDLWAVAHEEVILKDPESWTEEWGLHSRQLQGC